MTTMNIISNMTDNFDFHRREYITIRPWIKDRLNELEIECNLRYENESIFFFRSFDDIKNDFLAKNIMEELLDNKLSAPVFQAILEEHDGLSIDYMKIDDIVYHEHATTILKPMLDALVVFGNLARDKSTKVINWLDQVIIPMILREMPKSRKADVFIVNWLDEVVLPTILSEMSKEDVNIVDWLDEVVLPIILREMPKEDADIDRYLLMHETKVAKWLDNNGDLRIYKTNVFDWLDRRIIVEIHDEIKIDYWLNEDVLPIVLSKMSKEDAAIVNSGVGYLRAYAKEKKFDNDTCFGSFCYYVLEFLCVHEGNIDYLKQNPILTSKWYYELDPWNRVGYVDVKDLDQWSSKRGFVLEHTRDVQFIENNILITDLCSEEVCILLKNKYMMPLIERHINEFDEWNLSGSLLRNPSAIECVEQRPELIDETILFNPNIVTYNYDLIKQERLAINAELVFHPRFVKQWLENGNELEDYFP